MTFEITGLELRALLLQLRQADTVVRFAHAQVLQAHAGARELHVLARLEEVVELGVPLLEGGEHGRLHLRGELRQLPRPLDEQRVAVWRRPQRRRARQGDLAARADAGQGGLGLDRCRVGIDLPLQARDVAPGAQLEQVELGPEAQGRQHAIGGDSEVAIRPGQWGRQRQRAGGGEIRRVEQRDRGEIERARARQGFGRVAGELRVGEVEKTSNQEEERGAE